MRAPKDSGKVKPPDPAPQPPDLATETGGAPTTAESGGNSDDGPSQDSFAGEAQHMSEGPDDDMEGPGLEQSKASVVDSPTADANVKIETKPSVHQPNASNGTKQHRAATQMRDAAAKPAPGVARADTTDA